MQLCFVVFFKGCISLSSRCPWHSYSHCHGLLLGEPHREPETLPKCALPAASLHLHRAGSSSADVQDSALRLTRKNFQTKPSGKENSKVFASDFPPLPHLLPGVPGPKVTRKGLRGEKRSTRAGTGRKVSGKRCYLSLLPPTLLRSRASRCPCWHGDKWPGCGCSPCEFRPLARRRSSKSQQDWAGPCSSDLLQHPQDQQHLRCLLAGFKSTVLYASA